MIQIYDSLESKKVQLNKKTGEEISMYVCGPTVYDTGHLGHGRSAVAFDTIRRFFEFMGYPVKFVFNITDIDDKMIDRANKESISVKELAERITPLYMDDYKALGVLEPSHNPKATEYIEEMINMIQLLESKGYTYKLEDGIYFDISKFSQYGKLSHQKMDELNAGARMEERKDKRNHQDFVLWKFKKENDPFWESPWGQGRPGWHIECSAMSKALLGETFDIHGGGLDLKFPHHECEIAQSEGANGKISVRHWMHNGYITVNSEKMSKSLNNFFTLRDIFKEYSPRLVRFFLISSHYRSPIEFSKDSLEQAKQSLSRLDEFYLSTQEGKIDSDLIEKIIAKMSNDFDTAGTLALIFEWINEKPKNAKSTLDEINKILNIFPFDFALTEAQKELIQKREEARKNKDWALADEIRKQLTDSKIDLKDSVDKSFALPSL